MLEAKEQEHMEVTTKSKNFFKPFMNTSLFRIFLIFSIILSTCFLFKKIISPSQNPHFRRFIDHVMIRQEGIYTLMGSKPISWIDMSYIPPTLQERVDFWVCLSEECKMKYSVKDIAFPKYHAPQILKEWEKIQNNYLGSNFRIVKDSKNSIFFINLGLFLETSQEHNEIFCRILGEKMSPEKILDHFCDPDSPIGKKIKKNHLLLGLLLGYGLHNSSCFDAMMAEKEVPENLSLWEYNPKPLCSLHPKIQDLNLPSFRIYKGGEDSIEKYEAERQDILSRINRHGFYQNVYSHLRDATSSN